MAHPDSQIYCFLKTVGDSPDMAVDGSSAFFDFDFVAPQGRLSIIDEINIVIADTAISPPDFGGITNGLTNGLLVGSYDVNDTLLFDYTDGFPIKQNFFWGHLAGARVQIDGLGTGSLIIQWKILEREQGLEMLPGQKFRMTVQDDLTSLDHFSAMARGVFRLDSFD